MAGSSAFLWLHSALLAALLPFGVHRAWTALRTGSRRRDPPPPPPPTTWPTVTVQLPLYDERFVAARLLQAVFALDYPRDRLRVQVLDDSADHTGQIVADAIARAPAGLPVEHLRRTERIGYKAGALAAGLACTDSELIAVFDADFVPPPGLLRALVPHFADPQVGAVQARWSHLNADFNLLTGMQALLLDGHFAGEQLHRARAGRLFNFNGTAGVLRARCIEAAGGWQHDTLTEDLDLSYRAQLGGWRLCYRNDVACPGELPVDWAAFLAQQRRWAQGAVQTARKLLPRVWRAPLPLASKIEACFHLLGNLAFPLLLALLLTALPAMSARLQGVQGPLPAGVESAGWLLVTAGVALFFALARLRLGPLRPADLGRVLLLPALAAAMAVNNSAAVLAGLRSGGEFRRTPKRNVVGRADRSGGAAAAVYRARRGWLPAGEIALGLWLLAAGIVALRAGAVVAAAFHLLFAAGLLAAGIGSLPLPSPAPSQPAPSQETTAP